MATLMGDTQLLDVGTESLKLMPQHRDTTRWERYVGTPFLFWSFRIPRILKIGSCKASFTRKVSELLNKGEA